MNKKRLTLVLSSICMVALLVITVVPAIASPPEGPRAQFATVLEQLTGEGVISSEQSEIIMERTGPMFGRLETMGRACQQRMKELAVARSKPMLQRISQALGMEPDELLPQMKEGKTIAQIAEEQGTTVNAVVDELLAPVEKRLDRAIADGKLSQEQAEEKLSEAEARITEMVQNATLEEIIGHEVEKIRKQDGKARQDRMLLDQVCQIINLDPEELHAQLKEGKTIAEIAQEHGVSRDALIETLVEHAQDRLDKAVSDGRLDEEKAAEIMTKTEDRLTKFVDNFPPER